MLQVVELRCKKFWNGINGGARCNVYMFRGKRNWNAVADISIVPNRRKYIEDWELEEYFDYANGEVTFRTEDYPGSDRKSRQEVRVPKYEPKVGECNAKNCLEFC